MSLSIKIEQKSICLKWWPWILYGVSFLCFSRDETVSELTILPIDCYVPRKKLLLGWIRAPESSIYWGTGSFCCTSGDTTYNSFRMRTLPTFCEVDPSYILLSYILYIYPLFYTYFCTLPIYIPSASHSFLYTYDYHRSSLETSSKFRITRMVPSFKITLPC